MQHHHVTIILELCSFVLTLYVQYIYYSYDKRLANVALLICCLSSPAAYKCMTDQREQLEQTLPLVLGLILGLIIVITISVYHFHLKLTAQQQPQLPRDRSLYKNMWTSPCKRHAPFTFISDLPVKCLVVLLDVKKMLSHRHTVILLWMMWMSVY